MKANLQLSDIAERAIRTVAMRRGIPVEEVRREISLAILQSQPKHFYTKFFIKQRCIYRLCAYCNVVLLFEHHL